VRNLLSAMLVSTLAMILSTASPGICGFSEHILWSLKGNGDLPRSNVLLDQAGNLYGTAGEGGPHDSSGTVFEISAKEDKTVIWNFSGQDGAGPDGGLIVDANGALYVTTVGGGVFTAGTVFRLTPLPRLLGIGQSPFSGVLAMAMMARIRLAASLRMQAETSSAQQNLVAALTMPALYCSLVLRPHPMAIGVNRYCGISGAKETGPYRSQVW
jgi:hypothetical protein